MSLRVSNPARLADCARGCSFIGVIRSSPKETIDTSDQEQRIRMADLQGVRKSTRTLLRIAPLKTQAEAKLFAVFGMLSCKEVTRIRYED